MADITITELSAGGEAPDVPGSSDAVPNQAKLGGGDAQLAAEVNSKYARWRGDRRPYEAQWAVNSAETRGVPNAKWNPVLNLLEAKRAPAHRSRESINLILPKVKAKLSKHMKSRALPVVRPASTDHEDILNAKATTKVLEYLWEKLQLEEKFEEVILWSMVTGKAFWWFRWNEGAIASVKTPEDELGQEQILDIPLGEPEVEVGPAFELLVADPGIMRVANQPEIMRIKARPTADVLAMFNLKEGDIKPEIRESELFTYQRQIAHLGARAATGMSAERDSDENGQPTHSVVKELFTRPGGKFPNGRYVVVVGDQVVKNVPELPYGLATRANPYPVVEFADTMTAGQFWPTTMVEQLLGPQRQYRRIRNQVDEHIKLHANPPMFIPKQAGVHQQAHNSEAGQKIYYNFQPGMPPPQQWMAPVPSIAADVWRTMEVIRSEMDQMTNLYPASVGAQGATSGFDTNLLQEAADSVHAPDIRRNELALRDGAYVLRRLAKMGYDIPRLISIVGRDKTPDVFEFSQEQIDEHANIIIDSGSALPEQKHARIESILKLDERQVFGAPGDAQRNRKLLKMLDLGSAEEEATLAVIDEEHARLENLAFERGQPVEDPMPWEDHDLEYELHTALLKSPKIKSWAPEQRAALVRHTILHVKWKNPTNALQLAAVFGLNDVVQEIQQTMLVMQQAGMMGAAAQGQPPGPPQGSPQPGGEAPQPPPQEAPVAA